MKESEVGFHWNQNALDWIKLVRGGYDIYRNILNTPAFFEILPNVKNLKGLDIGCGEGYNTRLLVEHGAVMEAIDIAPLFIESAKAEESKSALGITYTVASATQLPFPSDYFDFATSFMCLMDMPDPKTALKEAHRVLKPGAFLQFSIEHPCFNTPHKKKLRNERGITYAVEVGDYFNNLDGEISEWTFGSAPEKLKQEIPKFKVPTFHRTLTFWINTIIRAGFTIEEINEPYPSVEAIEMQPSLQGARTISLFLHIRCRKK